MFINCPYCNALVATDPATDIPPERCPRCSAALRKPKAEAPPSQKRSPAKPKAHAAAAQVDSTGSADQGNAAQAAAANREVANEALLEAARLPHVVPADVLAEVDVTAAAETEVKATGSIAVENMATDSMATDSMADDRMADDSVAADRLVEAMLGPGAVEVEIAGAMPDGAHAPMSTDVESAVVDSDGAAPDSLANAQDIVETGDETRSAPIDETVHPAASETRQQRDQPPVAIAATRAERRSKSTPSFVRAPALRTPATRGWRGPAAIVALAGLLALQLLLADRAELAQSARWRPWIASLCDVLRCTIPPWREAEAFTLVERDVRPHPTEPGVLRVTASFRNDARWPQPWPRLALTLSDVDGREAGTRRFAAAEYLGAAPAQQELQSGQTATIAMDVLEPAPRIVAFTFEFH